MGNIIGLLLLLIHLLVCLGIWMLVRSGTLQVEGYFFPMMVLIPVWGPLCVLLLHSERVLHGGKLRGETLEKLRINEEIHRSILVEGGEDAESVIPLEEALLVNDAAQKRKLILSVLTDDPAGYYELLQQARLNEDSEVVHYASTALAQISKEADLKLQQMEQKYAAAPDDPEVLEEYCDYLEEYVESGFVQGRAAEIQQNQLEQLLKKRMGGQKNYTLGCKLAAVQLDLGAYDRADETLAGLIERWPQRETPWLLRLRRAAALGEGAAVQEILHQIDAQNVYLSSKGRETVRFWRGKEE